MRISEFDYWLPEEAIAQSPAEARDQSRLLKLPRIEGTPRHHRFTDIVDLLREGDLLVLNDTRVIPARLRGFKETGGKVEILLDRPVQEPFKEQGYTCQRFSCLTHSSRPLREGSLIRLDGGGEARGEGRNEAGETLVKLMLTMPVGEYLDLHGEVPLPAYIRRTHDADSRAEMDRERYQTIYAETPGAVAAPTAGLHFTRDILDRIRKKGVQTAFVTLHVGPGTFLPVRCEKVEEHRMHPERYSISPGEAEKVTKARREGRCVVAVGTTVVRTLEAAWNGSDLLPGEGETDLFIKPGYEFRAVNALLTNFHLPRSTLIMLVCAFAGRERVLDAYREAVERGYRFYSYGDAMFLR